MECRPVILRSLSDESVSCAYGDEVDPASYGLVRGDPQTCHLLAPQALVGSGIMSNGILPSRRKDCQEI